MDGEDAGAPTEPQPDGGTEPQQDAGAGPQADQGQVSGAGEQPGS
jgi:hypothetical protein